MTFYMFHGLTDKYIVSWHDLGWHWARAGMMSIFEKPCTSEYQFRGLGEEQAWCQFFKSHIHQNVNLGSGLPSPSFSESCGGIEAGSSTVTPKMTRISHLPTIVYRSIRPSDLEVLKEIHESLFPIRYESQFFLNVVNGRGIVSWAAVDMNRPDASRDEPIGFVTARVVAGTESEMADMLGYESLKTERTFVYILTLGVIKPYRNLGIASALVWEVIEYASSIPSCRAVYLHVISYNQSAILFYKKNSFRCLRKLENFYYINGHHYDAYLYIYYVNGGRAPCSALVFLAAVGAYVKSLFKSITGKLWKFEGSKSSKWPKCKGIGGILTSNHRFHMSESSECQCV
eukprot:Gb_12740 [translate_table: standard]